MKEISTAEARTQLAEVINKVAYGNERILLTRRGKGVAAVVPLEDLRLLQELEDKLDLADVERALADPENKDRVPWDVLKKQLAL